MYASGRHHSATAMPLSAPPFDLGATLLWQPCKLIAALFLEFPRASSFSRARERRHLAAARFILCDPLILASGKNILIQLKSSFVEESGAELFFQGFSV